MSLRVYNRKRKFTETPEPLGKKSSAKGDLRFVIQMHDATRLHFDLRLQFDGVFKSWAVPKGPSLNPLDQRLAVFVEDHPLEYGPFEGIIPRGNYGAGTVMVWDEGTYLERGSKTSRESNAAMINNFSKGHLTFILDGHKLKGEFALIKLKDKGEKAWLLVKKRDEFSNYKRTSVLANTSVKTGRTLDEIAAESEREGDIWLPKHGRKKSTEKVATVKKPIRKERAEKKPALSTLVAKRNEPLPRKVKPMLAIVDRKAAEKNWILEPVLNGLRAVAEVEGKRVSLYSKGGLSFVAKYPQIVDELKTLGINAVFDGEIVKSQYVIFDLLYWHDRDLRDEPLRERRKILQAALSGKYRYLKPIDAVKNQNELQVAKNPESLYHSGTSAEWHIVKATSKKDKSAQKTTVQNNEPQLTHLEKIYFPDDGITKGDLIEYYRSVADYILPYLKDRPESLNRHPNGIAKPGFYQKDITGHTPRWLKTERIYSESADKTIDYLLCQDEQSLLYMANLGCIEINPWFSRVGHLENPDFLVIDLDPDGNRFDDVIRIAQEFHEILDDIGAKNFCKTSGATGIHIGVPTGAKYDFDRVREFAENVCRVVAKNNPALTSIERNTDRRRKKIYLDFMQNRRGQTLAAPFCVRPHPGASVSMPVTWRELKPGLKPEHFNLHNAFARISKFNDPWRGVLGHPIDLTACAKLLKAKRSKD